MDGPEETTVLHPNNPNVYMFLGSKTNVKGIHSNSANAILLLGHDGRVLWLLHTRTDKPYSWIVPA
jgi:phosphoribosylformylglycinamidine (FGAM) synthase-like amidotransferase family enzyme